MSKDYSWITENASAYLGQEEGERWGERERLGGGERDKLVTLGKGLHNLGPKSYSTKKVCNI